MGLLILHCCRTPGSSMPCFVLGKPKLSVAQLCSALEIFDLQQQFQSCTVVHVLTWHTVTHAIGSKVQCCQAQVQAHHIWCTDAQIKLLHVCTGTCFLDALSDASADVSDRKSCDASGLQAGISGLMLGLKSLNGLLPLSARHSDS